MKEGSTLTVSYRNTNHIFPDGEIIDRTQPVSKAREVLGYAFALVVVHYFLWVFVVIGVLWLIYVMLGKIAATIFLLIYIQSFLRMDQFKTGRPWPSLRQNSLWHVVHKYLGVEAVRTAELDPHKQYIFGIHPHGILILSRPSIYGGVFETLFPGIELRVLGASPMFWVPGCKEFCLWLEAINAAKSVAVKALRSIVPKSKDNKSGKLSLMVYPGGSKEIFTTNPKGDENTIVARKGFIKLAIETGCDLVPGFVFGEKNCYDRKFLPKVIEDFFMKTLKLPVILFFGKFWTWLPMSGKPGITIVYGKPIPVIQSDAPTKEYIDELFKKFYDQIGALFETHKINAGYTKDQRLVVRVEEKG
ncbi:2-acylglycerol O-acyltransferase [Acrasis kona]|uniref:Acyltransferase n=1 Tax=Acrasis kona TaxID=1008807 RepID=A0AAW2YK26_9EUKA